MQVSLTIPDERIADLMITAIESGDPVTTASRGGWCSGLYWHSKDADPPEGDGKTPWYADPAIWAGDFLIQVIEVDDETTGHETAHLITRTKMEHGLAVMAVKFGQHFGDITGDNIDAATADIFLQCILFGEEKYA